MSKSNHEKIVALFEKEELEYKVSIFEKLRGIVIEGLEEHDKNLQDERDKFLKIKDQIQK